MVHNHKLKKGVIFFQKAGNTKPKIVVTHSMTEIIVKYFHEQPMFAHMGIAKTMNRVQKYFVRKGMNLFVSKFVKSCTECQKSKPAKNLKLGFMSSKSPESCNDVLYIDYVGPLIRTAKGNTAIFSVLDGYSKFVFFLAVRKQTSIIAIDCFKNFVFS